MFYSVYVLGKKGPLARIWLASHWDKKIPKSQILETDIAESCDSILQPKVKLSLRTYSHLLLGITRIYARKTQYLLQDCQEAVFKIKSAFRFDVVDLAEGEGLAPVSAITMPDMLTFINNFDLLPEPTFLFEPLSVNTVPAGPYANYNISIADVFSDSLDDPLHLNELRPDWSQVGSIAGGLIDPEEGYHSNEESIASQARLSEAYLEQPPLDDGFGGPFVDEFTPNDNVLGLPPRMIDTSLNTTRKKDPSMAANSLPMSPMGDASLAGANESLLMPDVSVNMPSPSLGGTSAPNLFDSIRSHQAVDEQPMNESVVNAGNESDLHHQNYQAEASFQANSFVLEPIDSQLERLLAAQSKRKKKRLILAIDTVNTLSNKAVRNQLANTSDIVTPLNLAPPNKTFMKWKRTATSDSLFLAPERDIPSSIIAKYFTGKLLTRRIDTLEDEEDQDPLLSMSQPEVAPESSISNGLENDNLEQQLEDLEAEEVSILGGSKSRKNKRKDENKENESSNPKRRRHTSKLECQIGEDSQGSIQGARQRESNSLGGDFPAGEDDYPGGGGDPLEVSSIGPVDASGMSALFDVTNTGDARQSEAYSMNNGHLSSTPAGRSGKLRPSTAAMMSKQPNETPEQFEDRKQSSVLLQEMAPLLDATDGITFSSLVCGNKKKAAALKFYNLLVLKRLQAVELAQSLDEPYSEITISKGTRFSSHSAICV